MVNGLPISLDKELCFTETYETVKYSTMCPIHHDGVTTQLFQISSNSIGVCMNFQGIVQTDRVVTVNADVVRVGVLERDLWRDPSFTGGCAPVFYISTANNITVYCVDRGNVVLTAQYHIAGDIEDVALTQVDALYLIVLTGDKLILINTRTSHSDVFDIKFREKENGVGHIAVSFFPDVYVSKGYGLYKVDALTGTTQTIYGFNERIYGLSLIPQFPFTLAVLTGTNITLFDTRLEIGVQTYAHCIDREDLLSTVLLTTNETTSRLTAIISGRDSVVIVPFKYEPKVSSFTARLNVTAIHSPYTLPVEQPIRHNRITGFGYVEHDNDALVLISDKIYRITAQRVQFGEFPYDKQFSALLPLKHTPHRAVPLTRPKKRSLTANVWNTAKMNLTSGTHKKSRVRQVRATDSSRQIVRIHNVYPLSTKTTRQSQVTHSSLTPLSTTQSTQNTQNTQAVMSEEQDGSELKSTSSQSIENVSQQPSDTDPSDTEENSSSE